MSLVRTVRAFVAAAAVVSMAGSGPAPAAAGMSTGTSGPTSAAPVQAAAACTTGARACPIRITFVPGAYSGQARGVLTGIRSQQWFIIHARAGQTMVVVVEGRGATRGIVSFPDGRSSGQPGGRVFDGPVPLTGDYRIEVTESTMGQAWSGGIAVVALIY